VARKLPPDDWRCKPDLGLGDGSGTPLSTGIPANTQHHPSLQTEIHYAQFCHRH